MVSFVMMQIDQNGISAPAVGKEVLENAIDYCSFHFEIDASLIRAMVEQESSGRFYARRYEDGFFKKYIAHKTKQQLGFYWPDLSEATERKDRATSWGVMQIMGQTARERGFKGDFSELLYPATGCFWGCCELSRLIKKTKGNIREALLKYNGGSNLDYPDEVMARI